MVPKIAVLTVMAPTVATCVLRERLRNRSPLSVVRTPTIDRRECEKGFQTTLPGPFLAIATSPIWPLRVGEAPS